MDLCVVERGKVGYDVGKLFPLLEEIAIIPNYGFLPPPQ
jgi:hypothetical protein